MLHYWTETLRVVDAGAGTTDSTALQVGYSLGYCWHCWNLCLPYLHLPALKQPCCAALSALCCQNVESGMTGLSPYQHQMYCFHAYKGLVMI